MANFIILTGIPGCGKSTVLDEALKICPKVKVINFGTEILKESETLGLSRDDLRKLPIQRQQEFGRLAAQKFSAQSSGTVVLDTHAFIKTPLGFCPGIPQHILELLKPKALAFIECDAKIIYERRNRDQARTRDNDSVEQIEYHQALNRSFMAACSVVTGASLTPIDNSGALEVAVRQLSQLLNSL